MKTISSFFLLAIIFIFAPCHALAGFKAMPIKIHFDSETKTATLKVENDGNHKTTIQIEAFEWTHDEKGNDIYTPAKDLIFFPKMLTLEKGEERIVRAGFEGKPGPIEKTYRLFLHELPIAQDGDTGVNMTLRMGLPVFVKPVKDKRSWRIESLKASNGAVELKVGNEGSSHIIVNRITVAGLGAGGQAIFTKETGGWYTHAGKSRSYTIELPEEDCLNSAEIRVRAVSENETHEAITTIDGSACRKSQANP